MKIFLPLLLAINFSHAAPLVDFGYEAKNNQFPNTIRIISVQNHHFFGLQEISNCTGSLISPTIVLTAAHCIVSPPNSQMYVSFSGDAEAKILHNGKINGISVKNFYVSSTYQKLGRELQILQERRMGRDYIQMSEYERELFDKKIEKSTLEVTKNDIALIELETPQKIQNNHLAKLQCSRSLQAGTGVLLAGYGANRKPNTLNANAKGQLLWGQNTIKSIYENSLYFISNEREKQLTNSGDSGGPLFSAGNIINVYGITVLKSSDKNGNSNGGYFNSLNSIGSKTFFKEVSRNSKISSVMKQSISSCSR